MSVPQLAFRLTVFTSSMLLVLAGLTVVLGQFRFEDYTNYEARFVNVSGLTTGEMVRVAGVEVGKVTDVRIQPDSTVLVDIDVDA
ncbi:MAG: MlaD family protein, partial [Rhodococcus sp. (in: high G+C Gram-positive bacteria)]